VKKKKKERESTVRGRKTAIKSQEEVWLSGSDGGKKISEKRTKEKGGRRKGESWSNNPPEKRLEGGKTEGSSHQREHWGIGKTKATGVISRIASHEQKRKLREPRPLKMTDRLHTVVLRYGQER